MVNKGRKPFTRSFHSVKLQARSSVQGLYYRYRYMAKEHLPSFILALLKPGPYSHPVETVSLVQTHISFVLLAGDYVYKFKKPVNFGFLDFSDLGKRKYCCEQELLLNRRLCPDIYLGLVRVCQDKGRYSLDGSGRVVEYGVKMSRMPEERMMCKLIESGQLTAVHVDNLVGVLAAFYGKAATGGRIDQFGSVSSVALNVLENFGQTERFVGQGGLSRERFDSITTYAKTFLMNDKLFLERVRGNHIRDCHGDLHSGNICLADKVYIYDCIEFNHRFRFCDVASDIAFLAMDLDYHGLTGLSDRFIAGFIEATNDSGLTTMLSFYKCYRAFVRGKIGLFTALDPAVGKQTAAESLEKSARYFKLAAKYAAGRP